MVGSSQTHHLAIRTDVRGKGVTFDSNAAASSASAPAPRSRNSSVSDDEQVHTHLSASSMGNTDTISSSGFSGHSTAMTSATTYDDRPGPASTTAKSTHAHPSLTLLELVSNSASSSALPDSFDFNVSRKGDFVAVYSSSNIWLIKTVQLPRLWARTLQVKRKPVAIDITEDGFLLAVLSRPSQVDLYEIHGDGDNQIKKRRTVMLVHEATSIVVSPDARILITGNKFGIEVMAIGPDAPETARRTLSGPAGDALEFSDDGRTLLITGYARKSDGSALFVLPGLYDGPLTEEGEPIPQPPETAWTGSVLFPETARIARQATLLPDADTGTFNELFAFNAEEDSWGIYDIACQRFTQRKMFLPDHQRWTRSEFVDDAMPAVSPNADLAAVALRMRGTTNIWIYEVPGWDFNPGEKAQMQAPIQPCFCIPIPNDGPDTLQEICVLRWVKLDANTQRLLAVGNSSIVPDESDVPGVPLGSKGVVVILDFDKRRAVGDAAPTPTKQEYDLDPLCPGEMLPEGSFDFEREVELVRTRTRVQRQAQDRRDALSSRRNSRLGSTAVQRVRTTTDRIPAPPPPAPDEEEELTAEEAQAAFEAPYDNQQPRSQMSLARAATVAAVSPANRRHLRALPFRPLEYRRADGHRELPHESDADNWVPPPPAYTATAAAAGSVSLSHPNAPPVPRRPVPSSSAIPPVPALPASITTSLAPSAPYQNRGQSISSIDLSTPSQQERERRPSLLHPSTYPSPQSSGSIRRRSSSARSPPQEMAAPQHTSNRPPLSHQNAASSSSNPLRRPSRRSRGAVGSTVDLRPPPILDPETGRRGSAPSAPLQVQGQRPIFTSPLDRVNTAESASFTPASPRPSRRGLLPRLVPPEPGTVQGQRFPMSAPPRTEPLPFSNPSQPQRPFNPPGPVLEPIQQPSASGRMSRMTGRDGARTPGPGEEKRKRKIGCVVM
ncbi:hypothetical protein FB567DRAFT_517392 [Paraphoma chrysanthemicola]|uniref:DUF7165 domain-containing protein n=1 Tax=Paraphoma chrysanthemicola TaxID=798071 RepID=A0A8K0RDC6_9PLEO|nr:hypothetical protein FB567DRAFT_517392 [Paraphoma chrysanthemicola]